MNLKRTAVQVLNMDEAVEMMNEVDFEPVNKIVSDIVGIPIKLQYSVLYPPKNGHPRVEVSCETDVKEMTGFLKNCFEKVLIKDFGANLFVITEFDKDEVDACVERGDWDAANNVHQTIVDSYFDLYLDARIYLKGGGENGLHILSGRFNFTTDEWKF